MAPDIIVDAIQTSDLPDSQRVIYSNELWYVSKPLILYEQFAERKSDFAGGKGTTVIWTVFQSLPPSIQTAD